MNASDQNALPRNLVMVCGAAYSGTTMLDLMLGNSSAVFSCGEIYALFRPFRSHHFDPECACGQKPCPVWQQLDNCPEQDVHARAMDLPGIRHVVDSSKDLSWVLDSNIWARRRGLRVANLLIWKDPIELSYSHWTRGRRADFFRRDFLVYYERFLALRLPFVSVHYQDLISAPATWLKALCTITGLPWRDGQEEFWGKQHHHLFGSLGTGAQVRQGESQVRHQTEYPVAFIDEFDAVNRNILDDRRLMRLIGVLQSGDFRNSHTAAVYRDQDPERMLKPLWYHRHRIKQKIRQKFPKKYIAPQKKRGFSKQSEITPGAG